jgi:transcriptional regulator
MTTAYRDDMYVPRPNVMSGEAEMRALVAAVSAAELITTGPDGYPLATLLPIIWRADDTVIAHMARANPHWKAIAGDSPVLLVCDGPDAYISPSWYPAKAEHGRVVPTWNYTSVHLTGRVTVHDDPAGVRDAVTELVGQHERSRGQPWHVTDAPAEYIDGQLRAIVGLSIRVERVEGKAKLSQNRSEADQRGVIDGLRAEPARGSADVADEMAARL